VLLGCNNSTDSLQNDSNQEVKVDVDLSVMSITVASAEFQRITTNLTDYMGKTIRMSGLYQSFYSDETGQRYHYIVLEGADACCAQGLMFRWDGDHKYPDDYPDEQARIEIVGVFGSFNEFDRIYYYLAVDTITVLN